MNTYYMIVKRASTNIMKKLHFYIKIKILFSTRSSSFALINLNIKNKKFLFVISQITRKKKSPRHLIMSQTYLLILIQGSLPLIIYNYRFLINSSAKSEVETSVAPSIKRAKS